MAADDEEETCVAKLAETEIKRVIHQSGPRFDHFAQKLPYFCKKMGEIRRMGIWHFADFIKELCAISGIQIMKQKRGKKIKDEIKK